MSENSSLAKVILEKAAEDTRMLIAYIASEGKAIDGKEYTIALRAIAKISALTPEEEAEFWQSYSALVKAALPARVDALSSTGYVASGRGDSAEASLPKSSQNDGALGRIRKMSIAAFCVTLSLLAYLSISESAMLRNKLVSTEYANLKAGSIKDTAIEKTFEAIADEKLPANKPAENKPPKGEADVPDSEEDLPPQVSPASKEERQKNLLESRKKELASLAGYNDSILRFVQFRWFGGERAAQLEPVDAGVLVTQQSINTLISKYMLPIFSALLGVTVFILRKASANFKDLSFRKSDSGDYSNRLALGVVGGLAISWFTVSDTTGIISSITPAALAFLVGYSVEVLYNILDSLVKALGANEKS